MTIWYVRENGDDASSGTSETLAKKTIKAAVDASAQGDVIDIGPGEFEVQAAVAIRHGLTLHGAGIRQTVVRGCLDYSHQFHALSSQRVVGLTFRDLTLDVANQAWDYAAQRTCIRVERVSDLLLERVRFVRPSAWAVVVGCGTPSSGTSADKARHYNQRVTVRGCEFVGLRPQEFSGFGGLPRGSTLEQLLIFNTATVLIEDCDFRDVPPSASGLGLYQAVRNVTVRRCTFDGSGVGAYYPITGRDISFEHCRFYGGAGITGARESDNPGLHFKSTAAQGLRVLDCDFECRANAAALELGAVRGAWVCRCNFVGCLGISILVNRGRDLAQRKKVNVPQSGIRRWIDYVCDDVHIDHCRFFDAGRFGNLPKIHGAVYIAQHHLRTLNGSLQHCRFERPWREGLATTESVGGTLGFPFLYVLIIEDDLDQTDGAISGFTYGDNEYVETTVWYSPTESASVPNVVPPPQPSE